MYRALTAFSFLLIFITESSGQQVPPYPFLKNGRLSNTNSLLYRKRSHPSWLSCTFNDEYFFVLQLKGIASSEQKATLARRGIILEHWLTGKTWLAKASKALNLNNAESAGIENLFVLPPELKIDGRLKNAAYSQNDPLDYVVVTCFPGDHQQISSALENAGAEIADTRIKPANSWFVHASPEVVKKLAELAFVYSLSPIHLQDVPLNYNNHSLLSVQSLLAPLGRNLSGKNLIVGIGDNADPSTHVDLSGKLIMRTDEPITNHGTHTSGTLVGGGFLNPLYTGMAPRAHLVVNDFSNIIVNSPTYVADYNIPLTSNSYFNGALNCPGDGEYDVLSNYVDSQMLGYPKLLHVFAAGNDGGISCGSYPVSFATIKSGFQTAKNVLTVGAMNFQTNSFWNGTSRGPVSDGRLKPEIVAGGASVTSTFVFNTYGISSGTSMACPTAAGILTLITERYRQLNGGSYPDAALLKTLIVNSADDLGNPGPDFTFGFGKINGRKTAEALEQNRYFSGSVSDGTNQSFTIPSVPVGNYQLKILLYWPDVPANPISNAALINDLDLQVTEPGGLTHLPMVLDPSPANVNNNAFEGADHLNNIEQVLVNNPPSGNYTLTVKGNAVPYGPQSFYLAYEIIPNSVTVEYPFGGETWVPGQTETIRWSAYGGDPNTFTIEYSSDGGGSWTTISNSVPAASRSYDWIVPSFTTNGLIRITRNDTTYTDQSDYPFTILNQPTLTATNTCPGYTNLSWTAIAGADSYDVLQLSGDSLKVIANTTNTSWLVTPLIKNNSYWFSVRPVHAGVSGRRSIGQLSIPNGGSCAVGLDNDLVADSVLAPVTGRQQTSSQIGVQQVSINVRNPGTLPTSGPISYSFQVNGGTPVTEVSASPIPAGSTTLYTFSPANAYDFSAAGQYTVKCWVHYAADTIPANDTVVSVIKSLRNDPLLLNPSFTESFEQASDLSYTKPVVGLVGLDRSDFSNSAPNGRLNTFFNSGFARTGMRSMLLDVTEAGTFAADSLVNTFNLSNYASTDQIWLDLYFKKQSAIPALPGNQVWIRGDDQAAWIPVKSLSDPIDPSGIYIKLNVDVTGTLAHAIPVQAISSSFQVRCGSEGKTPAASSNPLALPGGGISFDDFMFTRSLHDVGMRALIQPTVKNVCALGSAEKVIVLVRNYSTDTLQNVPVTYAINQDTVTEFISSLAPQDSLFYTFTQTVDMSAYQSYHIKTWVSSATDNYRNNDSSSDYTIQTTPLISQYPYLEGFEKNNGYWYSGGLNSSWQWGKPQKKIIHKAANGSGAWVTSLTGNYNDNEYSFLYSPCFDLTSLTKPVLSFSHIFQTEDDCNCDYHWVEYSLDDSAWTVLGNSASGVNWYDNEAVTAWQLSDTLWHVSSYDIPVNPAKIRFRFVMYSDPGTNYEGVAIDDVHIFDKAPVFTDSLVTTLLQPVSGSGWVNFDENSHRILSINPNGQNLGNTRVSMYRDTVSIRDTAGQYYGERNWVVQTATAPTAVVGVRYYFTDSEVNKLIRANSCASCTSIEDAYSSGITQYSSSRNNEEDSSLRNNHSGTYIFHKPQADVQIIPYDNGYYAETTVQGFSEFWINGGGLNQDHPLAAWLKDFTATLSGASGLLDWTSWQETGSLKYIVERSVDSLQFYKIGEVPAVNHEDSLESYHFTDPQLLDGRNYYRLVLLKSNGDSLVSMVRSLFYELIPTDVKVYPNPAMGTITVKTPSTCREMQIFDVLGRKLLDLPAQGYTQQVNLASFSQGVYFLKLFTDSGNKLVKLEKR